MLGDKDKCYDLDNTIIVVGEKKSNKVQLHSYTNGLQIVDLIDVNF